MILLKIYSWKIVDRFGVLEIYWCILIIKLVKCIGNFCILFKVFLVEMLLFFFFEDFWEYILELEDLGL